MTDDEREKRDAIQAESRRISDLYYARLRAQGVQTWGEVKQAMLERLEENRYYSVQRVLRGLKADGLLEPNCKQCQDYHEWGCGYCTDATDGCGDS